MLYLNNVLWSTGQQQRIMSRSGPFSWPETSLPREEPAGIHPMRRPGRRALPPPLYFEPLVGAIPKVDAAPWKPHFPMAQRPPSPSENDEN